MKHSGLIAPLLALDSSSQMGSVAVGTAEGIAAEVTLRMRGSHSTGMLPAIDEAVRAAGLSPRDLGAVVVGAGPGSFTGIRIAAATAKGIVHALGVPLIACSSLLAAAARAWASRAPVCALFDARGRDVFAAMYRFDDGVETIWRPQALLLDEVLHRCAGGDAPLFLGDGATRHRKELESTLGATVAEPHFSAPSAASLIWLAHRHPNACVAVDQANWEPDYLRASGAERIAAARAEAATER